MAPASAWWSSTRWRRLHKIYLDSRPNLRLYWIVKRVIDFSLALLALTIVSPLMIVIAVAVRSSSHGPIFFRQKRSGLLARTFTIYKFRTMVNGAIHQGTGADTYKGDPRITPIGNFLREYHLDELPQLFNVIKGDMSLVGPRPLLPSNLEKYSDADKRRLFLLPGVTSWATVNGGLDNLEIERFQLETWYVDRWNFWLDLNVLLRTFPTVLRRDGVYDEEVRRDLENGHYAQSKPKLN
ncbi:sugar transferase [filamentous cyanobacterium LEGE 11480]|uniref:Sugar transferase n=2 Tax=Romeriopsis TaxID=2992131 RepID=A0A928Z256_9CYAN|nr:sugar transferase [Romeriopsis navalis LEGE 11480]